MIARNGAKRKYSNKNVQRARSIGDQSSRLPQRNTSIAAMLYFNRWASRPRRWLSVCGDSIVAGSLRSFPQDSRCSKQFYLVKRMIRGLGAETISTYSQTLNW